MKKICTTIVLCLLLLSVRAQQLPSLHHFTATTISGHPHNFSAYSGKKILLVNTASYCMYTPQLASLEQLYNSYKQYNFEIVAFPCNDFGGQDPYSDSVINSFYTSNYNISFPTMSKVAIVAGDTSPVYKWLQRFNLNGVQSVSVDWNFNKFLINECGEWVAHYASPVSPMDTLITGWIVNHPACAVTTGINEIVPTQEFAKMTSANPAYASIDLEISEPAALPYRIKIFSVEGKCVLGPIEKNCSSANKISVDIASLTNGVYFVHLENGLKQKDFRFIVAK